MSFKVRQRVKHVIFGKGTVTEYKPKLAFHGHCQECGAKIKPILHGGSIVIDFDDHGKKELQMSFAAGKLKRVAK